MIKGLWIAVMMCSLSVVHAAQPASVSGVWSEFAIAEPATLRWGAPLLSVDYERLEDGSIKVKRSAQFSLPVGKVYSHNLQAETNELTLTDSSGMVLPHSAFCGSRSHGDGPGYDEMLMWVKTSAGVRGTDYLQIRGVVRLSVLLGRRCLTLPARLLHEGDAFSIPAKLPDEVLSQVGDDVAVVGMNDLVPSELVITIEHSPSAASKGMTPLRFRVSGDYLLKNTPLSLELLDGAGKVIPCGVRAFSYHPGRKDLGNPPTFMQQLDVPEQALKEPIGVKVLFADKKGKTVTYPIPIDMKVTVMEGGTP